MRYLNDYQIKMALKRGKMVGHLIGETGELGHEGRAVLRYLVLDADEVGCVLRAYDVLDFGRDDYVDIFSFPGAGDREQGEPVVEETFESVDDALAWAEDEFGASRGEWVNHGVLQDEYADCRR
jgi:hypothetical protein